MTAGKVDCIIKVKVIGAGNKYSLAILRFFARILRIKLDVVQI